DLIEMTATHYSGDADETAEAIAIPSYMLEDAKKMRNELIESVAEFDDELMRSEEHTSELQSRENLVCRLLLEKKKTNIKDNSITITKASEMTKLAKKTP